MRIPLSVILVENFQEPLKRCTKLPRMHDSIKTLHGRIANELGEFEEGQGRAIVLSLV